MTSSQPLVRPPKARPVAAAGSSAGAHRFAVIQSDSSEGTLSSYLVNIYGTTVASLAGAATHEDQDAVQSPASTAFYRGEVVAVRLVDGDWRISKLFGTSLSSLVEAGDLGCRALLRGTSQLTDLAWDYAGVRDALGSFDAIDVIGVIASTWWGYGYFPRSGLVPIVVPAALASRVATIDTASEASGVTSTIDYTSRFSITPAGVSLSLTWFWNSTGADPSTTVALTSGGETSRTSTTILFGAGASASCPVATLDAHPATTNTNIESASINFGTSTTVAAAAAGAEVVPDEGVRVNRGALVRVTVATNLTGGSSLWWRYAEGAVTETPSYLEFLPASGVPPSSAAATVGTGTVSLV